MLKVLSIIVDDDGRVEVAGDQFAVTLWHHQPERTLHQNEPQVRLRHNGRTPGWGCFRGAKEPLRVHADEQPPFDPPDVIIGCLQRLVGGIETLPCCGVAGVTIRDDAVNVGGAGGTEGQTSDGARQPTLRLVAVDGRGEYPEACTGQHAVQLVVRFQVLRRCPVWLDPSRLGDHGDHRVTGLRR